MPLQTHLFAYNSDNYGVLVHDPDSGETASVDAGVGQAVLSALAETGWTLTQIWITHHQGDHVAGLAEVKAQTGAQVFGPVERSSAIAGLDHMLDDGDVISFAGREVRILHTPGHTLDMINYVIDADGLAFTGDTLFTMGCGRVFEGTPDMMWASLEKLMALPPETVVFSAHEYTQANAAFAQSVDPQNAVLAARAADVARARAAGHPTVPTTMAEELATNPFLRAADPAIRAHLGMEAAGNAQVFARIRALKDSF